MPLATQAVVRPQYPSAYSLERYKIYACYIRYLSWTDGGVTADTLSVFNHLSETLGGPWLPRLQSLRDHSTIQPPPLDLLPHTLHMISFSPGIQRLEGYFIPLVTTMPPTITDLLIRNEMPASEQYDHHSILDAALESCFARHTNLRDLFCDVPIGGAHLSVLAHLPYLATLRVHITDPSGSDWRPDDFPAASFPALQWLALSLGDATIASPLVPVIEKIASSEVFAVDINFRCPGLRSEVLKNSCELFTALADSPFCESLVRVSFYAFKPKDEKAFQPSTVFTMNIFSPLLSLPNLMDLDIITPTNLLSSSDINDFASAWPVLRDIRFLQDGISSNAVSVDSLRAFTDNCPGLEKIGFDVMAPCNLGPRASVMLDDLVPSISVTDSDQCRIFSEDIFGFSATFAWTYLAMLFPSADPSDCCYVDTLRSIYYTDLDGFKYM